MSDAPHDPKQREQEQPSSALDDFADVENDDDEVESLGEAIEARDRNPRDEQLGRDALDDAVHLESASNDFAEDAIDEIAAATSPEDFVTSPFGDRRPKRDEAEMAFGAEPRSIDELVDNTIGSAIPGRRGTTREGEPHGLDLGK